MAESIGSPPTPDPLAYLDRLLRHGDSQFRQMTADRDSVYREYGRLFHPDNLDRLTADDFKAFLLYDNNRHWWGIHRHQKRLVSDMDRLRHALFRVLDESEPIAERLDWIKPRNGRNPVPGLGRAVLTPILHVVYPDRYGVWNSIAESAMTRLGLWPKFERGWGFGSQYLAVNGALLEISMLLGVDLWTVDSLWWRVEKEHDPTHHQFEGSSSGQSNAPGGGGRAARATATFVCEGCFQAKAEHLRVIDGGDMCVDCSGER